MKVDRKPFVLEPKWHLSFGPDSYHEATLGPLTPAEIIAILTKYPTPQALDRAVVDSLRTSGQTRLGDMLAEAVYGYNSVADEDDGPAHIDSTWRWLGIDVAGECDGLSVWTGNGGTKMHANVDQSVMDGEARRCALAALEALKPLVGKGVKP